MSQFNTTAASQREMARIEKENRFFRLLKADTFYSDQEATVFMQRFNSPKPEDRQKAMRKFIDGVMLPFDYMKGQKFISRNGVVGKMAERIGAVTKNTAGENLTHTGMMPQVIGMFERDGDEVTRDMEYMAIFGRYQITGSLTAKIVDVFKLFDGWREYAIGKRIETSGYKRDAAEFMEAQRFGDGIAMATLDLERNPMVTLNGVISALRLEAMDLREDDGYALIAAAATAAAGAGQFTNLNAARGVGATINEARNTLLTRNQNKGFRLSARQSVEIFYNPNHWDILDGVFTQIFPATRQTNVGRIVPNTTTLHESFNIDEQSYSGYGTDSVLMVLRGYKNIWCEFDNIRFGQNTDIKVDGQEVIGQEYRTAQVDSDLFQIVHLA